MVAIVQDYSVKADQIMCAKYDPSLFSIRL